MNAALRTVLFINRFNPARIAGLKVWLAADQIAGLNDADPVASWTDLSGSGNTVTQGTGAKQPTFKIGILNGLPIVRFDGIDDVLIKSAAILDGQTSCTIMFVYRTTIVPTGKYIISFPRSSGSVGLDIFATASTTLRSALWNGAAQTQVNTTITNLADGLGHIITMTVDLALATNEQKLAYDGNAATQGNNTGTAMVNLAGGGLGVGDFGNGFSSPSAGDVAEVVVYTPIVSATDQTLLFNYLKAKWGTV